MSLMVLTVISLSSPVMAAGASDGDEVGLLSVRQSLIPMFGKSVFFPANYFHEKHFPLTRLNPAVKPYLRAYLDDNRSSSQFDPSYRRGAIWLLGLIGDEQDITRVDRVIQERLKSGDTEESVSLLSLTGFIGYFAGSHERRGTKGIQVFIEKYGTPDAWAGKSEIGSPRSRELAVERCGNFLAAAYSYSRSSNLKSLVSRQDSKTGLPLLPQNKMAILQRQSVPVYDTLIRECTVEQSKLEMYYRKCFKTWGKDIERLIASVDTPDTRYRVQRDAGTQRKPSLLPKNEISEAEQAFVKQATGEAREEYERLKLRVVRGEFEFLVPSLLDNGRVIDQEKAKRLGAELSRDLQREQQVFESLAEIETEPGDFKVSRDTSYEFLAVDKEGMLVGLSKKEIVTVTFKLNGSSEVGTVLFRRQRSSLTVARDGTLIVVMKRIDDKWYWNPFGW